jgi:MoaA/NifB/PqqE/SkfB family radical SAM enzyme
MEGDLAVPYRSASESAACALARVVSHRGLVLEPGADVALGRHPACGACPREALCAPVFVAGTRRERLGAAPRVNSLPVTLDVGTSSRDLSRMLGGLSRHTRPAWGVVAGTVDHVRLDGAQARLVRGTGEPSDVADLADGYGVRVASTDLPGRSGSPSWRLGFVPARGVLAHRRERFATLFVLRRCTASCVMCHVQEFYRGGDMPASRLYALVEELRVLGYDRVDFFGGEPTLRLDLPEVVRFTAGLGCRVEVVTNGMTMTAELAAQLRDAGLALAMVSLDGPDAASHDAIRGVPGGWERCLRGVRALVEASRAGGGAMDVNLDTVVLRSNYSRMGDMVELARALGCTRLNLFLCVTGPLLAHQPMWLKEDEAEEFFAEVLPRARARADALGIELSVSPRPPEGGDTAARAFTEGVARGVYNPLYARGERCAGPLEEVFVTLAGDVFPCTSPSMLESEHRLGNAFESPLSEVIGGARHLAFCERAGAAEACRMCWRARPA